MQEDRAERQTLCAIFHTLIRFQVCDGYSDGPSTSSAPHYCRAFENRCGGHRVVRSESQTSGAKVDEQVVAIATVNAHGDNAGELLTRYPLEEPSSRHGPRRAVCRRRSRLKCSLCRGQLGHLLPKQPSDDLDSAGSTKLLVQPLEMRVDGVPRDAQLVADSLFRLVGAQPLHDFRFPRGQPQLCVQVIPSETR